MAANLFHIPDGVFKAKFNTNSDNWSAILPYIDGQKYTIGDTCTSRETQGEFIFLKPKVRIKESANPWNWSFGLEIFCEKYHYWVKAVEGGEIFQNGVKLDDKVKTRLNFGDIFTVAKLRKDFSGGLAIFTFKKRRYRENWDNRGEIGTSENPAELNVAFQNDLIFSKILSHLSVGGLKNARLVCRHWNEQVIPILGKKCVINLNCHVWCWCWPFSDCNPSLKLLQYDHDMENVADWPNLEITFPNLSEEMDGLENMALKHVADLKWFLRRGHQPKTLSLKGSITSDREYQLYLDTACQFKSTLEELHLDVKLQIHDGNKETKYSTRDALFFPVLKKFSIELDNRTGWEPDSLRAKWMKTWADAITQATSISTSCNDFIGSRFVQELQTTGLKAYPNLREISLTCKAEDAINSLTELDQPLKNLTLTLPLGKEHLPDFENLLKKFAPPLELLCFRVTTYGMEYNSSFALNLPCLPKLENLDFHFGACSNNMDYHYLDYRIRNEARLSLAFPSPRGDLNRHGIDYRRHLPSIRSIVVEPWIARDEEDEDYNYYNHNYHNDGDNDEDHDSANNDTDNYDDSDNDEDIDDDGEIDADQDDFWETYSDLIDSLLPTERGQSCKTLENFTILKDDIEPETRYRQAARLPAIFPNVRNEWMNRLRERINQDDN